MEEEGVRFRSRVIPLSFSRIRRRSDQIRFIRGGRSSERVTIESNRDLRAIVANVATDEGLNTHGMWR